MTPNTKEAQRAELHKTIWRIANDLRGSVDGWDFKSYVLGMLFYRFISENLRTFINAGENDAGEPDFDYVDLPDAQAEGTWRDIVSEKGFFIYPSELFSNVRDRAPRDANLDETLARVFTNIEASAVGTAIQLPSDLFFGTPIATCVMVLKQSKTDNSILFIDASAKFARSRNKNTLTPENQKQILKEFTAREDSDHVTKLVSNEDIAGNEYNLAVSSYVQPEDTREKIDIKQLNAEIAQIVTHQQELRVSIDEIVADFEGNL